MSMYELSKQRLLEIIKHWDQKEPICDVCEQDWRRLTTSQRREIRHDWEAEQDE